MKVDIAELEEELFDIAAKLAQIRQTQTTQITVSGVIYFREPPQSVPSGFYVLCLRRTENGVLKSGVWYRRTRSSMDEWDWYAVLPLPAQIEPPQGG